MASGGGVSGVYCRGNGRLTSVAQVQAREQHQRLEAQHSQRPGEDDGDDVVEVRFLQLDGRNNTLIARLFPQLLRAMLQDNRPVCLGQEDEQRPCDPSQNSAYPEAPSPAHNRDIPGDGWAENRAKGCRGHEACHAAPSALWVVVDVCAYAAHDADCATAADTHKKAEDNERSEVW